MNHVLRTVAIAVCKCSKLDFGVLKIAWSYRRSTAKIVRNSKGLKIDSEITGIDRRSTQRPSDLLLIENRLNDHQDIWKMSLERSLWLAAFMIVALAESRTRGYSCHLLDSYCHVYITSMRLSLNLCISSSMTISIIELTLCWSVCLSVSLPVCLSANVVRFDWSVATSRSVLVNPENLTMLKF